MNLAVMRLKQIFSLSLYACDSVDGETGTSFVNVLIVSLHSCVTTHLFSDWCLQDLSQYDNDELLHESLHLLGRIFSAEENLFEKAIQTQVSISYDL